jgi:hypothetical protein
MSMSLCLLVRSIFFPFFLSLIVSVHYLLFFVTNFNLFINIVFSVISVLLVVLRLVPIE